MHKRLCEGEDMETKRVYVIGEGWTTLMADKADELIANDMATPSPDPFGILPKEHDTQEAP